MTIKNYKTINSDFYEKEMLLNMKKLFAKIFLKIKDVHEAKRVEKDKVPSIRMAMFSGSIKRVK